MSRHEGVLMRGVVAIAVACVRSLISRWRIVCERSPFSVGGSLSIGHPFAATGGRILAALAKLLNSDPQSRRGLISVCTAGGMGVTAIVERA